MQTSESGGAVGRSTGEQSSRGIRPLEALNFFMADMQAGIGPFISVFLLAHGWQSGLDRNGHDPGRRRWDADDRRRAGALIDATTAEARLCDVIVPGICTVAGIGNYPVFAGILGSLPTSQIATAIAGAAIVPAVNGITLGIVHDRQASTGRTDVTRHSITPATWLALALSGYPRLAIRLRRQSSSSPRSSASSRSFPS